VYIYFISFLYQLRVHKADQILLRSSLPFTVDNEFKHLPELNLLIVNCRYFFFEYPIKYLNFTLLVTIIQNIHQVLALRSKISEIRLQSVITTW